MSDGTQSDSDKIKAALTEYKALRDEILFHMSYQRTSIVTTVAFSGTAIGFGIQNNYVDLLLIYPIFAFAAAMIWIHESSCVSQLGRYIHKELECKYNGLGWEKWNNKDKMSRPGFRAGHFEDIYACFLFCGSILGPTLLAFAFTTHRVLPCQVRVGLLVLNLLLAVVFFCLMCKYKYGRL